MLKTKKKKKKKKKIIIIISIRILILFFINISGELVIHDHQVKFWFNLLRKLYTSPILPNFYVFLY